MDAACPTWAPDMRACAGNGVCLTTGDCACNDGWQGVGDFIPLDVIMRDCSISKLAVTLLWAVTAVSLGSLLVSATIRIIKAIRLYHATHVAIGQPYGHEASTRRPPAVASQFRTAPSNPSAAINGTAVPMNAFAAGAMAHSGGTSPGGTLNNGNMPVTPNGHGGIPMTAASMAMTGDGIHSGHGAHVIHQGGSVYHGHGLPATASSNGGHRAIRQYTSHAIGTSDQPLGSPNHPAQSMAFNHERNKTPGCCITTMTMFTTLVKQLPFLMAMNCVAFGVICSVFIALKLSGQSIGHDVPVTVFFFLTGAVRYFIT